MRARRDKKGALSREDLPLSTDIGSRIGHIGAEVGHPHKSIFSFGEVVFYAVHGIGSISMLMRYDEKIFSFVFEEKRISLFCSFDREILSTQVDIEIPLKFEKLLDTSKLGAYHTVSSPDDILTFEKMDIGIFAEK